jgi:hypothetical protein
VGDAVKVPVDDGVDEVEFDTFSVNVRFDCVSVMTSDIVPLTDRLRAGAVRVSVWEKVQVALSDRDFHCGETLSETVWVAERASVDVRLGLKDSVILSDSVGASDRAVMETEVEVVTVTSSETEAVNVFVPDGLTSEFVLELRS